MSPTSRAEANRAEADAHAAQAAQEQAEEDLQLSSQAHFSTYSEDDDEAIDKDKNPPDGPHVKQEKGKPSEGPVKAFGES